MSKLHSLLLVLVVGAAGASCWAFCRFTADEAEVGWRAAAQLVERGAWDAGLFEVSPLRGLVSLAPPLLGVDPGVFFTLLSGALLWGFLRWVGRVTQGSWLAAFALVGLPATVLHAFSGLETFLFAALLCGLFVALQREAVREALGLTLLLFITRPEAWVLVVLVPMFFFLQPPQWLAVEIPKAPGLYAKNLGFGWERGLGLFAALALPLIALLAVRPLLFGSMLPADLSFTPRHLGYLAPLVLLAALGQGRLALVMGLSLGTVAGTLPDAAGRWVLVAPLFVVLVVTGVKTKGSWIIRGRVVRRGGLAHLGAALLLLAFAAQTWPLVGRAPPLDSPPWSVR